MSGRYQIGDFKENNDKMSFLGRNVEWPKSADHGISTT